MYKVLKAVEKVIMNKELDEEEQTIINNMTEEELEEWKEIYHMLKYNY